MHILRYQRVHEDAVITAIKSDPDWDMFSNEQSIDNYKKSLLNSITYVCYQDDMFCGYLRALLDDCFAIYISELFVVPECRDRAVGRSLLAKVNMDYPHLSVYVLSDEDAYYRKLGYEIIGSVFKIHE
jgi:ribosomal protein S18 acetylase RimI-like enzyme